MTSQSTTSNPRDGDNWECRWDRHPNPHNTRLHFTNRRQATRSQILSFLLFIHLISTRPSLMRSNSVLSLSGDCWPVTRTYRNSERVPPFPRVTTLVSFSSYTLTNGPGLCEYCWLSHNLHLCNRNAVSGCQRPCRRAHLRSYRDRQMARRRL